MTLRPTLFALALALALSASPALSQEASNGPAAGDFSVHLELQVQLEPDEEQARLPIGLLERLAEEETLTDLTARIATEEPSIPFVEGMNLSDQEAFQDQLGREAQATLSAQLVFDSMEAFVTWHESAPARELMSQLEERSQKALEMEVRIRR